jgi:hypothetical protein
VIGDFLRRISAALERSEIPYMVTGSMASSMYGVPRATNDVDIIIAPTREQMETFIQLMQRLQFYIAREEVTAALANRTMFSVMDFPNGWKADLIVQKNREFSITEFGRRETHEVEGLRLTIATPEDVLLGKLEWAKMSESERQIDDAAGILRMQKNTLDLPYIESWLAALGLEAQWTAALLRSADQE